MPRWYHETWPEYVPVAKRREVAQRQVGLLRRLGIRVQPVQVRGSQVASSVWGKAWCHHLESFSDYANRLPRGRSYVRHDAVVHLELDQGMIRAFVHGTETYYVEIAIATLAAERWQDICRRCRGRIDSLLALLEGRIDHGVMAVVADRRQGLLPMPGEIRFACSCPDRARMCKHVAATLYGVGHRLDTEPGLLFELRGVSPDDLLGGATATAHDDDLAGEDLAAIFGVEMDDAPVAAPVAAAGAPLTAEGVRGLRQRLGDTVPAFAARLGVTPATVARWETLHGPLRLWGRVRKRLEALQG
jgi:uncharacterized Zn finger protein